jgi:uncharacterized surface protein with fasciclin (FAS1) repeats
MKKIITNQLGKVLLFLIPFLAYIDLSAQITSTAVGGNWNETSTWQGGTVPLGSDNVIIAAGATVNLNAAGACNNLTVNGSLVFNVNSIAFNASGTTTINNGGVVNFTSTTNTANLRSFNDIVVNNGGSWNSNSLITITGNITNNGSFTTGTAGTITLSGVNKTFSGANIRLNPTTLTVSGSYTNMSDSLRIDANLGGNGALTNGDNRVLILLGATNSISTLNAGATGNTVIYQRNGTQQVKQGTYHNLLTAGNNTKTAQGPITINNNLTIGAGTTFHDNGHALTGAASGTLNINGELQLGAATVTNFPITFGNVNINAGSTVHFSTTNAAGQLIPNTIPYVSLRVSGNSVKRISGNISLSENLTISSGTLDLESFNITVNGDVTNSGTQAGAGKIILTNGTSAHTISGTGTYQNLELNDALGASLGANLTVNGTLTMSLGALRTLNRSVTIRGDIQSSGQGFFSITAAQSGDIFIEGSNGGSAGNIYMDASPNNHIRRFTMNRTGSGASVTFANTVNIRDQFNVLNGAINHSNGNLRLGNGTSVLQTTIANGTISSPPVFNNFTGGYRVQYGSGTILNTNLITGAQGEIPSSNTLDRLIIDNNTQNTITLAQDLTITGAITLTSGFILLGDRNIIATYTGTGSAGSANSYLITNGSGQFFRNIPAGSNAAFNFPVGTQSGYALVNINFIDNSNMSAGRIGVRALNIAPPVGQTPNYLNKHWVFSDERTGNAYTYRPTFNFNNTEVTGTASELLIGRFDGSAWNTFQPTTVSATSITMPSGSINLPLSGNGVLFSGLSEPQGVINPNTVWDIISSSADHTTLKGLIETANLVSTLQSTGPMTVFAPDNAAFADVPTAIINELIADPQGALTNVLLYHVLSGTAALAGSLTNGQILQAANSQSLTVTVAGPTVSINDAQVIIPDLTAQNGIVHSINKVLIPDDDPLSTNDFNKQSNIQIYPNPTSGQVFVKLQLSETIHYEVMSIDGKVIFAGRFANDLESLDLSQITGGIYFININDGKKRLSKKIVKQ